MNETAVVRRPLSDAERDALRPEIDRDALEQFLGRIPPDFRGEILSACQRPGESPAAPPVENEGGATMDRRRTPVGNARQSDFASRPYTDISFMLLDDPSLGALWRRVLGRERPA